ncbi:MAG: phenylacetate--CoA ligase family protein [Phycisphaerae bacterium]
MDRHEQPLPEPWAFPGLFDVLVRNPRRSRQATDALALAQLKRLLTHAYTNVPLYRDLWNEAGVAPDDLKELADLRHLPMVDKDAIVTAGDRAMDQRLLGIDLDSMSTSGTSGRAITLKRTTLELRLTRRSFLRALLYNGVRPWQHTVTFASTWLASKKGTIVSKIAKTAHILPTDSLDAQIELLRTFRADNLIGQTGGLYLLARELLRRGQSFPLRTLVPTGATLMPEMRRTMRQAFGTEPRDLYGAIELGTVSWQGPTGAYHMDTDRVIVEIVDDRGTPLPPGRSGQVVCTSLYGATMPLIRYKLLDVASLSTERPTGTIRFPVMGPVKGRINDFLPTPNGDLVSPHFLYHIFDGVGGSPVKEWRIIQHSLRELTYEYVPEPNFRQAALEGGMETIRRRFGADVKVAAVEVPSVPMTPNGKRTCIVSKLHRDQISGMRPWDTEDEAGMSDELMHAYSGQPPSGI